MRGDIVVIHQPDFMPYLGFFDRLVKSDIFVVLDTVQYEKNGWMSRDRIKTLTGPKWLTVPIQKAGLGTPINKILLVEDKKWKEKNINLIIENYKKASYFEQIFPYVKELYQFTGKRMVDFNMQSINMLLRLFDIDINIVYASDLNVQEKSNELIVEIVQKVGARKYLSGAGAKAYYKSEPYKNAGINVIWQEFSHPVYTQQFEGFEPNLSSIDLLFNCGIDQSRKILKGEKDECIGSGGSF